jgi:hypothetical protein
MHARAVQEGLAERYLLQELSGTEAEEFERHYFECEVCAAAVETGEILIANTREVLSEAPVREPARSVWERLGIRWTWSGMLIPATAMALLVLSVYQAAVVIPGLRRPRVLPAFQLVGASRGEDEARVVPRDAAAFALTADIPPDVHFSKYVCSLEAQGRSVFAIDAAPPAPGQPITLLVPTKGLTTGRYRLTIVGSNTGSTTPEKVFSSDFELAFR